MQHIRNHSSVEEVERAVLTKARWMFPLLLAFFLPILYAAFRAFVLLEPAAARWPGVGLALMLAGAGWVGGVILVAAWRWMGEQLSRSVIVSGFCALLVTAGVEAGLRYPATAHAIWAAVKHRCHPVHDYFLRESASFHVSANQLDSASSKPRLIIFGSSQLNLGLDHELLQSLLPSQRIERRSLAGMGPARMLVTSPLLGIRPDDVVLVYWSEFDVGAMSAIDANWFRPFGNRVGLSNVLGHMREAGVTVDYKAAVDMRLASFSRLWRMRDGLQFVTHRMTGDANDDDVHVDLQQQVEEQASGYAAGLQNEKGFAMGLHAATSLIKAWREAGAEVVVLEGSVNPGLHTADTEAKRHEVATRLLAASSRYGARFVAARDQGFQPQSGDWIDGTHFNEDAKTRFTQAVAAMLADVQTSERDQDGI